MVIMNKSSPGHMQSVFPCLQNDHSHRCICTLSIWAGVGKDKHLFLESKAEPFPSSPNSCRPNFGMSERSYVDRPNISTLSSSIQEAKRFKDPTPAPCSVLSLSPSQNVTLSLAFISHHELGFLFLEYLLQLSFSATICLHRVTILGPNSIDLLLETSQGKQNRQN